MDYDYKALCLELLDDLDSWMEYDERPSSCIKEYENTIELIKKTRKLLEINNG